MQIMNPHNRSASTAIGSTYLDRCPRRLADSVITALKIAPSRNETSTVAQGLDASHAPCDSITLTSVALPVMCETVRAQNSTAIALVYPAIHDSEIARRDFWRSE